MQHHIRIKAYAIQYIVWLCLPSIPRRQRWLIVMWFVLSTTTRRSLLCIILFVYYFTIPPYPHRMVHPYYVSQHHRHIKLYSSLAKRLYHHQNQIRSFYHSLHDSMSISYWTTLTQPASVCLLLCHMALLIVIFINGIVIVFVIDVLICCYVMCILFRCRWR